MILFIIEILIKIKFICVIMMHVQNTWNKIFLINNENDIKKIINNTYINDHYSTPGTD